MAPPTLQGWTCVAASTAHVLLLGAKNWPDHASWPLGMPTITLMSVLLSMLALALKLAALAIMGFQSLVWLGAASWGRCRGAGRARKVQPRAGSASSTEQLA